MHYTIRKGEKEILMCAENILSIKRETIILYILRSRILGLEFKTEIFRHNHIYILIKSYMGDDHWLRGDLNMNQNKHLAVYFPLEKLV